MVSRWILLLIVWIITGCSPALLRPESVSAPLNLRQTGISVDTTWSGRVVIDGQLKVFKGATLTISPGTDIIFIRRDDDKDGLGDGTLIVEGSLQAIGTASQPIRFYSASDTPQQGDWLEIRVDFSKETHLRYCDIRDSAHGLHAHFTKAVVEDSHIHRNIDGCRLGQGNFIFRRNLIEENEGKGLNFRNSTIEITDNIIRHNGAGIFLFETDRPPTIEHNNIYANDFNLRLGDFFHRDLQIGRNWWGSSDPNRVSTLIYDAENDATIGRVTVDIAPSWLTKCGPGETLSLRRVAAVATDGFVDSAPQPIAEDLLVASWDGSVLRIDKRGRLLWKSQRQEVIDAPLLVDSERIYGQNWGREVFALNARDGALLWTFNYPASPFDDHRQGGLIRVGNLLLVPAWNGTLYALDPHSGKVVWSFSGHAPLRAKPFIDKDRIILSGGDGTLWTLGLNGSLLWRHQGSAPLLTSALHINGMIISLDREGRVIALDDNGNQLWLTELKETCYYAAPVSTDDSLFVSTTAGALWKLDPVSGNVVWRVDGFGAIYSTPLIIGQHLIIGDNDGVLRIIDSISGNILARLDIGAPIQGGPSIFAGGIALGSRDRYLYILSIDSEP